MWGGAWCLSRWWWWGWVWCLFRWWWWCVWGEAWRGCAGPMERRGSGVGVRDREREGRRCASTQGPGGVPLSLLMVLLSGQGRLTDVACFCVSPPCPGVGWCVVGWGGGVCGIACAMGVGVWGGKEGRWWGGGEGQGRGGKEGEGYADLGARCGPWVCVSGRRRVGAVVGGPGTSPDIGNTRTPGQCIRWQLLKMTLGNREYGRNAKEPAHGICTPAR